MINISEIVKTWEVVDGWHISAGVSWCRKGFRVRIGSDVRIGSGHIVQTGSRPICTLGLADGYQKSLSAVDGVAYIGAGCRWFTLDDAIKHWSNHDEDRNMTLCLLESAKAVAKLKGLKSS